MVQLAWLSFLIAHHRTDTPAITSDTPLDCASEDTFDNMVQHAVHPCVFWKLRNPIKNGCQRDAHHRRNKHGWT
jgi:hypothetical protein